MAGENIPFDYLADHLNRFTLLVSFIPGSGFIGKILFNDTEVYSSSFKSDAQETFNDITQVLEDQHEELLSYYKDKFGR